MTDERRQFRLLYRDFLARLIEPDLLSAHGEPQRLAVQMAALLLAFNFVLAAVLVPQYAYSKLPYNRLVLAAVGDQEFLIGSTMAVVGAFTLLAWGAFFPNPRDILVLGVLPVRMRTIIAAKVAAIATGLGVSILAANLFTGLTYPLLVLPPERGLAAFPRAWAAYWMACVAAGAFVFLSLLSVQGVAASLLPYRLFARVSGWLQVLGFFTILGVYFLTPGGVDVALTSSSNQDLLGRFPSFWFLGLYQQWNGAVAEVFQPLGTRALHGLAGAAVAALLFSVVAYRRSLRSIVEGADITASDRVRPASRLLSIGVRRPLDRAILFFTASTFTRSRQHRAVLAMYAGIGLAVALAYSKSLVYQSSRGYAPLRRFMTIRPWYELNVPLLAAGLLLLIFVVLGAKAAFSLPIAPRANWIFRVTAIHPPAEYFAAVRRTLYRLTAVPVWLAAAICYLAIWPLGDAVSHILVLLLVAVILVEGSLREFRKLPFACSYLPGKGNLPWRIAMGIILLSVVEFASHIEDYAIRRHVRLAVLMLLLGWFANRAHRRWKAAAYAPGQSIQFDDLDPGEVSPLDLRNDGAWSYAASQLYSAPDPAAEQPWKTRLLAGLRRAAVTAAVLLVAGTIYEEYEGRQQNRLRGPQVGQSYDIGGRSLNMHCAGSGSPAVIFESGGGGWGYGWIALQRPVSKITRACWYDRAGFGWSDPGPYPRDSKASAADLQTLLSVAHVDPPYVLVAASLGGLVARVYAAEHPEQVAGMVLVDSSHADEREPIPSKGDWEGPEWFYRARVWFVWGLWRVGFLRLTMGDDDREPPPGNLTEQDRQVLAGFDQRGLVEFAKVPWHQSLRQARAAEPMRDKPLLVLTAGLPSGKAENPVEARQAVARQKRWITIQEQLLRYSNRGRQVLVGNSRHCIQCDAPEAILNAVEEVVAEARSGHR